MKAGLYRTLKYYTPPFPSLFVACPSLRRLGMQAFWLFPATRRPYYIHVVVLARLRLRRESGLRCGTDGLKRGCFKGPGQTGETRAAQKKTVETFPKNFRSISMLKRHFFAYADWTCTKKFRQPLICNFFFASSVHDRKGFFVAFSSAFLFMSFGFLEFRARSFRFRADRPTDVSSFSRRSNALTYTRQ